MNDPIIAQAIQIVHKRYTWMEWALLPTRQVTAAIYQEVRRLDLITAERRAALQRDNAA